MKYLVDIDGTICTNTNGDYDNAIPMHDRIQHFNKLYNQGHEVHYWTARGSNTGKDWTNLTKQQLEQWGVQYTSARAGKPSYDIWIDDKATNVETYFNEHFSNR